MKGLRTQTTCSVALLGVHCPTRAGGPGDDVRSKGELGVCCYFFASLCANTSAVAPPPLKTSSSHKP
jgi:hypothetical protein